MKIGAYIQLTKPRITVFILMSTAIGYFCGAASGSWSWLVCLHALLGTALMASGTAALNQWYEREGDGQMLRTRSSGVWPKLEQVTGRTKIGRAHV